MQKELITLIDTASGIEHLVQVRLMLTPAKRNGLRLAG